MRETPGILIVDDNSTRLSALSEFLEEQGFFVMDVNTVSDAIEVINTLETDLVLVNLELQGLDAFNLVKIIRQTAHLAMIPVLAMNGIRSKTTQFLCESSGFNGHLANPANKSKLMEAVQYMLKAGGSVIK